jgi:L-rhamnose mutarotase
MTGHANVVQRFAAVVRLRPEREAEYRALHSAAWPGVVGALQRAHVRNYSIFVRDGLLFSYLEYDGNDHEADFASVAVDETTQRWLRLTDACQQRLDFVDGGPLWAPAEELFHLD